MTWREEVRAGGSWWPQNLRGHAAKDGVRQAMGPPGMPPKPVVEQHVLASPWFPRLSRGSWIWGGGVGVPAHQAGGPGAGAVVHLHEVEAAVLVRLQAEVVEAQIHHVAHGHRDLPQAQLPGRGDTVKLGRGTR